MDHGSVAVGSHQGPVATHAPPGTTHAGSIVTHSGLLAGHGGPHASSHAANHSANHAGPDELEALLRTIGAEEAYAHAHQQMAPKPQLQQIAASGANTEPINIEKKHKCEYCPFGCNNSGDYKRHMRTHTGEKPFECDKCGAKFARSGHLKVHMKYHSGDKPHQCTQCPTSFVQAGDLKKHMRYHTGEKPYQCNQCQAKFIQLAGLKAHVRTHTGEKPFKCETCEKAFKTKTDLVIHERGHTGEKPYDCVLCPSKFLTSGHLRRHERSKHGENLNITSDTFQCKQCHSKFNSKTRLTLHVERYHGVPDNDNINPPLSLPPQHLPHMNMPVNNHLGMPVMMSPGFAMNSMAGGGPPHSAVSQSMMHGANTLPSMASSDASSMMSGGAAISSGGINNMGILPRYASYLTNAPLPGYESYTPPQAQPYNASTQNSIQQDRADKRYKCVEPNCIFACNNSGDFKRHMRTHTGEKPFACDRCSSTFARQSHLALHIRSHTGERPYTCSVCNKSFLQFSNLKIHMRGHTGEKPYPCSECPARFTQSETLRTHMRIHTGEKPYKCEECLKTFRQYSALVDHKRMHTGERPYKCKICETTFIRSSHLRRHEKHKHRGDLGLPNIIYQCPNCSSTFKRKDGLNQHVKINHPDVHIAMANQTAEIEDEEVTIVIRRPKVNPAADGIINSLCKDTRVGSKKRKPAVVKRRFLCDQCGSTFQVAAKFKQHLEKVHQIEVISFDDMTTKSTRKRKAPKRKSTRPARVPANTQPDHPENEDGESVQPVDEPMDRANNETDLAGNETDPERPLTPSEDELDHTDRPVSPEHKVSGANAFEKIQITIEKPQGSSPTKMDVAFSPDAEDDYQSAGDEPNDTGNTENIEGRDESSETEEPDEPAETDQRAPAQLALYEQSDINQTERVVEPPASPDSIKQEDPTDPSDETDEQTGEYQPSESTGQMETDENITEQH